MNLSKDNIIIYSLTIIFLLLGFTSSIVFAHSNENLSKDDSIDMVKTDSIGMVNFSLKNRSVIVSYEKKSDEITAPLINFKHGDISWLPGLASQAGWPKNTHDRLAQIILRESGGCPNRRGGDIVDKNCVITGVSEWNHRSDTGLLQINGVNYDLSRNKWARVCLDLNICIQEPLLDPLTNLKAGYLLYTYSGWAPWDPCQWGPKYAHRCKP